MAELKRVLRVGKRFWFAALLAVACTPAAAASLPAEKDSHGAEERSAGRIAAEVGLTSTDLVTVVETLAAPVAPAADVPAPAVTVDAPTTADAPVANEAPRVSEGPRAVTTTAPRSETVAPADPERGKAEPTSAASAQPSSPAVIATGGSSPAGDSATRVTCAITVSAAGRVAGLDKKQGGTTGTVSWTWTVAAGAQASNWAARVECSNERSSDAGQVVESDSADKAKHEGVSERPVKASEANERVKDGERRDSDRSR